MGLVRPSGVASVSGLLTVTPRNGVTGAVRTNDQRTELRCWALSSPSSLEQPYLCLTPGRVRGEAGPFCPSFSPTPIPTAHPGPSCLCVYVHAVPLSRNVISFPLPAWWCSL